MGDEKKKTKRFISAEQRFNQSIRMKAYWKKRKEKEKLLVSSSPKDSRVLRSDGGLSQKQLRKENINREMKIPYAPYPYQYRAMKAIDAGKKVVLFVGGIQSGKTHMGSREILRAVYGKKKKEAILAWIVAPTYPMAEAAMRKFEEAAGNLIVKKRLSPNPEYLLLPPYAGGPCPLIQVKSTENPDRLRGAELDFVWMDEAAMMSEETFDIIMGRVLTRKGTILMTTTPKGMNHWLYTQVVRRAEDGDERYYVVRAATEDNPIHEKRDLDIMREKYTDEFEAQELMGEFVNFSGLIYPEFEATKKDGHLFNLQGRIDRPDAEYIMGIDWGWDDPFVSLWIVAEGGHYYVVDEYYKRGEIPATHLKIVKAHAYTQKLRRIYSDVSRPESREEFRLGLGMPILPGRTERDDMIPGITYINSLIKQGRLHVAEHCRHIISEFGLYSWRERKDANSGDKPRDHHNHCLDALRYALYSHRLARPAQTSAPLSGRRRIYRTTSRERPSKIIQRIQRLKRTERMKNSPMSWMSDRIG